MEPISIIYLESVTKEEWLKAKRKWKKWVLKTQPDFCQIIVLDEPSKINVKFEWSENTNLKAA